MLERKLIEYIKVTRNLLLPSSGKNILFCYVGNFNFEVVNSSIEDMRVYLNNSISNSLTRKRIYSLIVESLDNIYRHGESIDEPEASKKIIGYFLITQHGFELNLEFGNFMKADLATDHQKRWLKMLKEDEIGLTENIKKQIKTVSHSDKNGAGIGFMDIKRKLEENARMKIFFNNFDKNLSLYVLQAKYSINK